MIFDIDKTHAVFELEAYKKDIVPFSLMELIKQDPLMLKSNGSTFILGMSAPHMPIWVWTSDDIVGMDVTELIAFFYEHFKEWKTIKFVAKPGIARPLAMPFVETFGAQKHVVCMQSYVNPLVIRKTADLPVVLPNEKDIPTIAKHLASFQKESFGESIPADKFMEAAKNLVSSQKLWVIKNGDRVVSMAQSTRETPTHISVSRAYTMPSYRNRGYAAALVSHISEIIQNGGKIPTLYTDLSNPCSNKAYKNVGFVECGQVDEVTLTISEREQRP